MTMRAHFLLPLLSVGVVLSACTPSSPGASSGMPVPGSDVEEKEVMNEESSDAEASIEGDVNVKVELKGGAMMQQARIVAMSVDNWSFSPSAISAKKGEKVKIRLTGVAGAHGFAAADLGINTAIAAGQTVDVELPTDKTGSFNFRCSVPCGQGHREMKGIITITE